MGIYSVIIKKNGSVRLEETNDSSVEYMHFDSMSQLVNYCDKHNIDVEVGNVHHECD